MKAPDPIWFLPNRKTELVPTDLAANAADFLGPRKVMSSSLMVLNMGQYSRIEEAAICSSIQLLLGHEAPSSMTGSPGNDLMSLLSMTERFYLPVLCKFAISVIPGDRLPIECWRELVPESDKHQTDTEKKLLRKLILSFGE